MDMDNAEKVDQAVEQEAENLVKADDDKASIEEEQQPNKKEEKQDPSDTKEKSVSENNESLRNEDEDEKSSPEEPSKDKDDLENENAESSSLKEQSVVEEEKNDNDDEKKLISDEPTSRKSSVKGVNYSDAARMNAENVPLVVIPDYNTQVDSNATDLTNSELTMSESNVEDKTENDEDLNNNEDQDLNEVVVEEEEGQPEQDLEEEENDDHKIVVVPEMVPMARGDYPDEVFNGEISKSYQLSSPSKKRDVGISLNEQITITFEDLYYAILKGPRFHKTKCYLLKGVTGVIKPGRMTALMGPSGAGKTTLLNVLSGRINSGGIIEGSVLFNGKIRTRETQRKIGYVEQKDLLIPYLTVREMLTFTAKMRITFPKEKTAAKQSSLLVEDRVTEIIKMLGLNSCENTLIGGYAFRGISGGQAKRVSCGLELLTSPAVLFLDEPTSGLDSSTAYDVMNVVKNVCNSGVNIICTIHQPSSDIFSLFDVLILLLEGELVYTGSIPGVVTHFESFGYPCPGEMNHADYILAAISGHVPKMDFPELEKWPKETEPGTWQERYQMSDMCKDRKASTALALEKLKINEVSTEALSSTYANGILYNVYILFARDFRSCFRDKFFLFKRLITNVVFSLVLMSVYIDSQYDSEGIRNRQALLLLTGVVGIVSNNSMVVPYILNRPLVSREITAGIYQPLAYYIEIFLFELPYTFIRTTVWSCVLYFAVPFYITAERFFVYYLTYLIIVDLGVCFAQLYAGISKTIDVALAMQTTIPLVMMIFSGFFIDKDKIPDYWIWAYYISYLNYPLCTFMINEFKDNEKYCYVTPYSYSDFGDNPLLCDGKPFDNTTANLSISYNFSVDGDFILRSLGTPTTGSMGNKWVDFVIFLSMYVFYRIVTCLVFVYVRLM